jgi:hypothetical protein
VEGTEVQMAVEVTSGKDGEQENHANIAMEVSLMVLLYRSDHVGPRSENMNLRSS